MAALIGTSNCFCSGLAVEPDEVETVWHDDQLMWSRGSQTGNSVHYCCRLETNCCCQVNKKPRPHQSSPWKPSLSLWFRPLVYKALKGPTALWTSDRNSADLFGQRWLTSCTSTQLRVKLYWESMRHLRHKLFQPSSLFTVLGLSAEKSRESVSNFTSHKCKSNLADKVQQH